LNSIEVGQTIKNLLAKQAVLFGFAKKEPYRYIPKVTKGTCLQSKQIFGYAKGTYKRGVIKSYSFRTITHPAFNEIYNLFICTSSGDGKKTYKRGLITNYITSVGLSYWVRDDGNLQKNNEIIFFTMGFTEKINIQIVIELNRKFKLNRKVVCHKKKYWAIYIPASDAPTMREHLQYLPDSMKYKMPLIKKKNKSLIFVYLDLFFIILYIQQCL
jgi:hypothetical protein